MQERKSVPSWRARCWACGVLAVLSGASITCLVASPNSPPAAATPLPSAAVDPSCQALSRRTRALHALVLSSRPRPSPESESTSMAITAAAASSSSMSSQPMWQRREVAGWADEHGSALLMGGQTSDQFGSGLHYPRHPSTEKRVCLFARLHAAGDDLIPGSASAGQLAGGGGRGVNP